MADCGGAAGHAVGGPMSGPGLREVSRAMARANPVFIVGEARSGTSILYRTLHKHPAFAPKRQSLVETEMFAHLRHPVDVYSSYRRRAAVDPSGGWADVDVRTLTARWTTSTARALSWLDSGRRNLRTVRYESFVADPAAAFRSVCAFLDEPFDAQAVEETHPDSSRWRVDSHLWGEIVPRTKEWRDHITLEEAAMVQDLAGPTMRQLGYAPYPTG